MKKILGVVGSPRKNGNTHILVTRILEGARSEGASVETLFLGDLHILECDGCHACWEHGRCAKHDDMNGLYPAIIESDVIVFGTPVYWYGPTALMKGFIDRFVFFNCPVNREKIRGTSAALAIPLEEEREDAVAPLVTFFEKCFHYLELNLTAQIIVHGVTRKGEIREKEERLEEAFEMGRRLGR